MKTLLLIFFIPLLSYSQNEIEFNKENLEEVFKILEGKNEPFNQKVFCQEAFQFLKIKDCSPIAAAMLLDHYDDTYDLIQNLKKEIANEYAQRSSSPEEIQTLNTIKERLNCIEEKYYQAELHCTDPKETKKHCELGTIAYVQSKGLFFLGIIPLKETTIGPEINYCPLYFNREFLLGSNTPETKNYNPGVLIHELAHLCGADDHRYLEMNEPPLENEVVTHTSYRRHPKFPHRKIKMTTTKKYPTEENADTYNYWARYGFCFPGECNNQAE